MGDDVTDQKEVYEVLAAFVAGEMTMASMISDFKKRDWSRSSMDVDALHRGDDVEPHDWSDVEGYRLANDITEDEYQQLVDAVTKDNSKVAEFKENQGRDESGKWSPDGGHWTWGGGNDVQPRGWSKRYPGLKDPEPFHEGDQTKLDPSWVENVIPEEDS